MGWLDTKESHKHQNVHVFAKGSLKQADRIHERDRKRNFFIVLDLICVFCLLIGVLFLAYGIDYKFGAILIVIGLIIIGYFIFRKRKRRRR